MLKRILETLDGLSEAMAKEYKKGEDGKFYLEIDGGEDVPDGLKSALQKERERANAAEKALKAKERADEDAKRKAEEELALKRGEFDKIRAQDLESLKKEREEKEALQTRFRNEKRDRALMEAMTADGVKAIPKALLPHIQDLVEVITDGNDLKTVVKGNPGQKLVEFVSGFKRDMPWAFEGVGSSGGGSPSTGSTSGKSWKDMSITEQTQLYKTNPTQAKALMQGA
jgi:hypothetical protein